MKPRFPQRCGLPLEAVRRSVQVTVGIPEVLGHILGEGAVYRALKPEDMMVDLLETVNLRDVHNNGYFKASRPICANLTIT